MKRSRGKHIRGHEPAQTLPTSDKTDLRYFPQGEGPVLICPHHGKCRVDQRPKQITVMVWVILDFTKFLKETYYRRPKNEER
ncbi:hypothetical protein AD940_00835 [Gluconobacter thailandicus]|nr:hypothetical protein AD940_00835 [Gluconobacter thailandicus]